MQKASAPIPINNEKSQIFMNKKKNCVYQLLAVLKGNKPAKGNHQTPTGPSCRRCCGQLRQCSDSYVTSVGQVAKREESTNNRKTGRNYAYHVNYRLYNNSNILLVLSILSSTWKRHSQNQDNTKETSFLEIPLVQCHSTISKK